MPSQGQLTPKDVQELARAGHVAPHPKWHGRVAHGVKLEAAVTALCWCFKVERDRRPGHPDGFVAFGRTWAGDVYRVDFNLGKDLAGQDIMYLVTAMKMGDQR